MIVLPTLDGWIQWIHARISTANRPLAADWPLGNPHVKEGF